MKVVAKGSRTPSVGRIDFPHPWAFWTGVLASISGVLLHLPMYFDAADMHYQMKGMSPDAPMIIGMVLIVAGLAATAYGLIPRGLNASAPATDVRVRAMDNARVRPAHIGLIVVTTLAVTIDTMKPITLSFVAPGVAAEYGLKSPANPHGSVPVALLPLFGLGGTVLGSFVWGWLGDRVGRRASILLAGVMFVTTAICGAMPGFAWNLVMCFLMGLAAGGMLPITFSLLAETIPARHRGWVMVLIGGNVALAYIVTSWLSATLVPHYSWRILWLLGMPTGVLLIALNHWIPESPRFLLTHGRDAEARAIMTRYGAAATDTVEKVAARTRGGYLRLFSPPFTGLTAAMVFLGIGIGLVTYGFQLWIPTNLQHAGLSQVTAARVLRDSAIIGLPLIIAASVMYGFWSAKKTLAVFVALVSVTLVVFAAAGNSLTDDRGLLYVLLAAPICGTSAVTAILAAYSSEIYPTRVRSRGAGLSAGAGKTGGVAITAFIAAGIAGPSLGTTALLGAVPLVLALGAILFYGVETGRRATAVTSQPEAMAADA